MQCPILPGLLPVVSSCVVASYSLVHSLHADDGGCPWARVYPQSPLPPLGAHALCHSDAPAQLQEHVAHRSHQRLLGLWVAISNVLGGSLGTVLPHRNP